MIPLLLSVTFGAGIYLLYEGLTHPREVRLQLHTPTALDDFLRRAGLPDVTPRDFALFSLCAGLVTGLLAQLLLGWPIVSILAALFGLFAPLAYYVQRHDRRRAALQNALVEAIAQLRDAIRTGLSVQDALVGLARTGPETLRPPRRSLRMSVAATTSNKGSASRSRMLLSAVSESTRRISRTSVANSGRSVSGPVRARPTRASWTERPVRMASRS